MKSIPEFSFQKKENNNKEKNFAFIKIKLFDYSPN